MRFFSDNAAAACPEVLAALHEANRLDTAYDGDAWSRRLNGAFSALFGTEVEALWVATGTAANPTVMTSARISENRRETARARALRLNPSV